jgi:DNA-binding NtrC family response regulator
MTVMREKSVRVLVVDDEEVVREVLLEALNTFGYETASASNGEEALQAYKQQPFDIVLSDLMMSPMDGMELLNVITEIDPKAIFIMITGYPSIESAVESIKIGARDYISKPFNLDELKMKIERALLERSLKERLKNVRGVVWALLISIPAWLILGIILARALR